MSPLLKYYTKRRDVVQLPADFNEELVIGDFIIGTKKIIFGYSFNKKIPVGVIPPNVKEIIFGIHFNQELQAGVFPDSVTVINFGSTFNSKIAVGAIPSSIKEITFNQIFNQELEVGVFPEGVTQIWFGRQFNQRIKKDVLPKSLIGLSIGSHYSHQLEIDVLPINLKYLQVFTEIKQIIHKNILPPNLKKIVLQDSSIELGALPDSIESLILINCDDVFGEGFLPSNLKYISLPYPSTRLNDCIFPQKLEKIRFTACNDQILSDNLIPSSVHTVIISDSQNLIINSLPDTIKCMCFSHMRKNFTTVPMFISTIKVIRKKDAKYFIKTPFGCEIVIMDEERLEYSLFKVNNSEGW